ncbi:MAG: glycosyltransferase family 4 protein [Ferruginibacter sp.]
MVIWYLCKYASPEKYFFGTRHFYLGKEWVKQGHDVTIITSNSSHLTDKLPKFDGKFFEEDIDGINTIWLNGLHVKKSSGASRILSWMHFEWRLFFLPKKGFKKPDVIIASSLSLLTVVNAYIFSKKYKAKFIFEVRDIWPLSAIELGNYSKYNPFIMLLSKIEKLGYKKANAIVGTIPNLGARVEEVIGSGKNCYCIPQGISMDFYSQSKSLDADYKEKYIPKNKFIIAYAGTLNANNPLETFIEAAKLLQHHKEIHFLIVGKGDRKEHLVKLSQDIQNVSFIPAVNKNQVNSLLHLVSICYDSFSSELARFGLSRNKWIDYMHAAKPIICSYSGFQSMINEAKSGAFVEYGNAEALAEEILKYSKMHQNQLKEIGENGKKFLIENRTFDRLAAKYIKIIERS